MKQIDIQNALYEILRELDIGDILINKRTKQEDRTESLISNLRITIKYLLFNNECLKKELFDITGDTYQE